MTTDTGMVEDRMSQSTVEQCARAVQDVKINGQRMRFSDEYAVAMARSVLECLRIPTPEMVEAMGGLAPLTDEDRFTAAIDRALSPSKGEGSKVTYPPELLPVADEEAEVIVVDPDTRKETVVWPPLPSKEKQE